MAKIDRRIVLPEALDQRLKHLATLDNEAAAALFFTAQNRLSRLDLMVDTMYMAGIGQRAYVIHDPERAEIINDFLREHPEYDFIDWHTQPHSIRPSNDDLKRFRWYMERDPKRIMMITSGERHEALQHEDSGNLSIVVVPTPEDFYRKEEHLKEYFAALEKARFGGQLTRLNAVRRRH